MAFYLKDASTNKVTGLVSRPGEIVGRVVPVFNLESSTTEWRVFDRAGSPPVDRGTYWEALDVAAELPPISVQAEAGPHIDGLALTMCVQRRDRAAYFSGLYRRLIMAEVKAIKGGFHRRDKAALHDAWGRYRFQMAEAGRWAREAEAQALADRAAGNLALRLSKAIDRVFQL